MASTMGFHPAGEGSTPSDRSQLLRFSVRLGRPSDLPYVEDTWAKRGRGPHERIGAAKVRIRAILGDPGSLLRVAVLPDDDDAILGWAVWSDDRIQFAYVRKDARGQGVAKALCHYSAELPKT